MFNNRHFRTAIINNFNANSTNEICSPIASDSSQKACKEVLEHSEVCYGFSEYGIQSLRNMKTSAESKELNNYADEISNSMIMRIRITSIT
jgi:hypothetical protein